MNPHVCIHPNKIELLNDKTGTNYNKQEHSFSKIMFEKKQLVTYLFNILPYSVLSLESPMEVLHSFYSHITRTLNLLRSVFE